MSDGIYTQGTIVSRVREDTPHGPRDLIILTNEGAPVGYERVVAGRAINGHFQAALFMDFAMSPDVLRKIADLIEIKALGDSPGYLADDGDFDD